MWPCYSLFGLFFTFFSSIRSSSVHHGLLHTYKPLFSNCSSLEQSCLCTFIIHFHFCPVFNIYRTEPGNNLAWITLTTHAHTNFFKILQGSSDPTCAIFSKCVGFNDIKHTCTRIERILHTSCAHLLHTLHTSCAHLAHILHTFCAHLSK